jgi:hypothetical protein
MYTRLTPRGLAAGKVLAQVTAVGVIAIAAVGIVRAAYHSITSSTHSAPVYRAMPVTPPRPAVPQPDVQPVAQVKNLTPLVPSPPPRRPQLRLPAGTVTFVPLLKKPRASSPRSDSVTSAPVIPPSPSGSRDLDRRRYDDHYARHDDYRPPPPRISYQRSYSGRSYAGSSSSLGRRTAVPGDEEGRSHR